MIKNWYNQIPYPALKYVYSRIDVLVKRRLNLEWIHSCYSRKNTIFENLQFSKILIPWWKYLKFTHIRVRDNTCEEPGEELFTSKVSTMLILKKRCSDFVDISQWRGCVNYYMVMGFQTLDKTTVGNCVDSFS